MEQQNKVSRWSRLKELVKNKKIDLKNNDEHIFNIPYVSQKNQDHTTELYTFEGELEISIFKPETHLDIQSIAKNRQDKIDSTGHLMWPSESFLTSYALSLPP